MSEMTATKTKEAVWQCCLMCGRTITDREQHDALEASVLQAIRAEHPEWADAQGDCAPCVTRYREVLKARTTRAEAGEAEQARVLMRRAKVVVRLKHLMSVFMPATTSARMSRL